MTTPNTGEAARLPAAKIYKRLRWLYPAVSLVVIAIVLVTAVIAYRRHTRPYPRVTVSFDDIHGLEVGSTVELGGERIGEVAAVTRSKDLRKRRLVLELIDDAALAESIRREGTEFYIDYLRTDRLQIRGATRVIHGPSIVVRVSGDAGKEKTEFDGFSDLPPDPRLPVKPVRLQVNFDTVWGLEKGAPVRANGKDVGLVEAVEQEPNFEIAVKLAFFQKAADFCPYTLEGTRYFVNHATLSPRGVEGDGSTLLFGAHLVAVPDPLKLNGNHAEKLVGEAGPPPRYLPQEGEKELTLDALSYVPPDSPVQYRGETAGYIHSFRRTKDGNGYIVRARIYPWAQAQIGTRTCFFLEPKFKAQLFRDVSEVLQFRKILEGRNPVDFSAMQGPKFEIPYPDALFRPAVAFRTPPGAEPPVDFSSLREGQYVLYPDPSEEWLSWRASLPTGEMQQILELPAPVPANFSWKENSLIAFGSETGSGLLLPVDGGIIGIKELLEPGIPLDKATKLKLTVRDNEVPYTAPRVLTADLRLMKTPKNLPGVWPRSKFAKLVAPQDLLVLTPGGKAAIDAQRILPEKNYFRLTGASGYSPDWHGAPAVAVSGENAGKVVAFVQLVVKDERTAAFLCPAEAIAD